MEDNIITNLPSIKLIQDIHNLMTLHTDDEISRYTLRRYFFQQINQINDIPVCVILFCQFIDINAELHFDIYYCIASRVVGLNDKILYRSNSYGSTDSILGFTDCLYDLYKKLPQFRISNNTGKFYVQNKNTIDEELGGNYLLGEECTVCMEKTMTKTSCHHYLCICCWNKLGHQNVLLCPICRKQITPTFDAFFIENDMDSYESEGWALRYGSDTTNDDDDDDDNIYEINEDIDDEESDESGDDLGLC